MSITRKILEFEKFNTYPDEIKNIILDNLEPLKEVYYGALCRTSKQDFDGYFNGKYGNQPIKKRKKIIQVINDTLENYYIVGFHISRLIDNDIILNNGLKILDSFYYQNYMKYVFQTILHYNDEKVYIALQQLNDYLMQHEEESRKNTLSLFAPPSDYIINLRNQDGFISLYGEYVGGEIAKMAFSRNIKEDLHNIGEPKVIQFLFPFKELKTFGELPKDFAINQIVFLVLQHILNGKLLNNAIFQAQITQSIPAEDIIKIWTPKDIVNAYHGRCVKINGKFQRLKL